MHPLGTCPLGFSKRPLRVRVSEFGMIANDQLTNELSNSKNLICLPSEPVKRLLTG
jgi:hypothetical protein